MAKKKTTAKGKKVIKAAPKPKTDRSTEIFGVILICFGIIFGIAVYSDHSILLLDALHTFAFGCFGLFGYLCPVVTVVGGALLIFFRKKEKQPLRVVLGILGILSILAIIHFCSRDFDFEDKYGEFLRYSYLTCGAEQIGGGVIGALLAWPICGLVGKVGGVIIYLCVVIISVIVVFDISLKSVGDKVGSSIAARREEMKAKKITAAVPEEDDEEDLTDFYDEFPVDEMPEPVEEEDEEEPFVPASPIPRRKHEREPRQKKTRVNNSYMLEDTEEAPAMPAQREELPQDAELTIIGQDLHGKFETASKKRTPAKPQWPQLDVTERPQEAFVPEEEPEEDDFPEDFEQEQLPLFDADEMGLAKEEPKKPPKKKTPAKQAYRLPPVEILAVNKSNVDMRSAKNEIETYSQMLEDTLESFNVSAKVINAERGPKVTRYELQPAPGVKISKILGLQDDIALNLAAESIRIVAPIPGKAAVGIELPNKDHGSVMLRELVDAPEFKRMKGSLIFALGKDIMGQNVYSDLKKMPHLLVAGTTGSGKSVCLNTIIMSMLYRSTPDELKFMMIDPKRGVEMAKYNGLPNLIIPVVIEPAKAAGALQWAVSEMISRYKQFTQFGSKDLERHNEKLKEKGFKPLHKLVIIIDEFADLMMISSKEVEDAVCRIAQLGRASGIHLIIATQSPRADIFTGLIKANVPSRIALTVGNALESRIIMDAKGAEQLLGQGDMLFRPVGEKATRIQGCWVSDPEIEAVVEFLKEHSPAEYDESIDAHIEELAEKKTKTEVKSSNDDGETSFGDDLTKKAIEIAAEYEGVSASMLQRRLRVGYARAARLVDELEELGVVGPADGSKPRQLLLTREDCIRLANADEFMEE